MTEWTTNKWKLFALFGAWGGAVVLSLPGDQPLWVSMLVSAGVVLSTEVAALLRITR